jgi:hypothetical protein
MIRTGTGRPSAVVVVAVVAAAVLTLPGAAAAGERPPPRPPLPDAVCDTTGALLGGASGARSSPAPRPPAQSGGGDRSGTERLVPSPRPEPPGSATRARSGGLLPAVCHGEAPATERPYFQKADWLWDPIPEEPRLDPQSEDMVGHLATGDHIANTGDFAVTLIGPEGIDESTPRFPVGFLQDWGLDPFGDEEMPIPDGTPVAPGSDGHLAVADPVSGQVFNLWMAERGSRGWNAGWGAMTPLDGDGRELNGSSTGAGIARFAAVVRADEIAAGKIPHALFFSTNMAAPDEVRYPATKTDGSNMDGVGSPVPEGARVQLDPTLDLDSLDLGEGERIVAEALQTYGAFVGDNGGARMAFLFEYAPGSSVYEEAGLVGDYVDLGAIPWDRLRVLAQWDGGTGGGDDGGGNQDPGSSGDNG